VPIITTNVDTKDTLKIYEKTVMKNYLTATFAKLVISTALF